MPPWAQLVAESAARFFVTMPTRPTSAARSAKKSPAMPLPMTRKSNSRNSVGSDTAPIMSGPIEEDKLALDA
jgi:hypothetical protein